MPRRISATFSVLLFLLASCAKDGNPGQRTNWAGNNDELSENQSLLGDCTSLRSSVEAQIAAINSCQSNADCALSQGIRNSGFACHEIGYNRSASTQGFNDALSAYYKGCGRFNRMSCNGPITTNQPCVNNRCIRNVDQITTF